MARVETGSRLHGGFYYAGLDWNIRWGGLGFYVEEPKVVVEARSCNGLELLGFHDREALVKSVLESLNFNDVCLEAHSLIPAHVGLGSTTQLLLASIAAVSAVKGLSLDPLEVAARIGRGSVSWIGSILFKFGGFIVDGGSPSRGLPKPLVRLDIPEDWVFTIVIPNIERGLSEDVESRLLRKPWNPDLKASYYMSRGALRLASAIAREDLADAIEGLREVQLGTGLYFSQIQGGVYRGVLNNIVDVISSKGIFLAQSSWGPTLYTITSSADSEYTVEVIQSTLEVLGFEGVVMVSKPRNKGARIY